MLDASETWPLTKPNLQRLEGFYFSSSEFRVRKVSFKLKKRVSSKNSEFRVRKVSFELKRRVSSKKSEFRVRKMSFELKK